VSDSAAADIPPEETATPPVPPFERVRVVPTRPDGWPDWLGRRPISPADRDKILKDLQAGQDELNTAERRDSLQLAPLFSCLTIEGLAGQDDPRTVTRLRASINVAFRVAAGDRRTSYHATDERITLGRRADGESVTSIAKGLTYKTASGQERTVSRRALYNAFKAYDAERSETP